MFTLAYWKSELITFREVFIQPDLDPMVAERIVRGLCFLTLKTEQANPTDSSEILDDFRSCMVLVTSRMGQDWLLVNLVVFADHGMPT